MVTIKVQRNQNIDSPPLSHVPSIDKADLGAVNHKDDNLATCTALENHELTDLKPTI